MMRGISGLASLAVVVLVACGGPTTTAGTGPVKNPEKPEPSGDPDPKPEQESSIKAVDLDAGDFHTCGIFSDGNIRCWGHNDDGQMVDTGEKVVTTPHVISGIKNPKDLACGSHFSCALLDDGKVKCWGSGRILNDGKDHKHVPPTEVKGLADVEQIQADGYMVCARTKTSTVKCWGLDKELKVPPMKDVQMIRVAKTHGCALLADKTVKCFGADSGWGGANAAFANPKITGVERLLCSGDVCCALAGGAVKCWGKNLQGEMGRAPDAEEHVAPTEIPGVSGAKYISGGIGHLCAITPEKPPVCWGTNGNGELGHGSTSDSDPPGPVQGLPNRSRQLVFGSDHACARMEDGPVYCWGSNKLGQLGDGTTTSRTAPKRIKL
jgi:alpha-tubulin suppressor-like RCC1 family protein